jgi:hypothetical protein
LSNTDFSGAEPKFTVPHQQVKVPRTDTEVESRVM